MPSLALAMSHAWGQRGQSEPWDPQHQLMHFALTAENSSAG